jgi:hypothetical protein
MSLFLSRGSTPAIVFLCLHTAVWTLYATLSNEGALHLDMIEAYSWGREFQLGYYKHPPLWAWIAGAWFQVFPRTNWAFYLLATLNSAIGIAGVWKLTGLFTKDVHRLNATLLILLFPFYTVQGHQYNANFIQLSIWPWTAYFFVRSIENRRLLDAILFGVMAAAGLLSKYYSALLLLSCVFASFFHASWRQYYRSSLPYVSVAVCVLFFLPHLWWLVQNDFAPIKYAGSKTEFSITTIYGSILTFILGCIVFSLPAAGLIVLSRQWSGQRAHEAGGALISPDYESLLAILALGPFFLTLLSALLGHVRLSTNFASPLFFLVPLLLIQTLKPPAILLRRLAGGVVGALYACAGFAGPTVPHVFKHRDPKPAIEVTREAKRVWSEMTGLPLRVVAGSEAYAMAAAFYNDEDTSAFLSFDLRRSPWISPVSLTETGFLGICGEDDETCHKRAAKFGSPTMQDIHLLIHGNAHKPVSLRLFMSAPVPVAPGLRAPSGAGPSRLWPHRSLAP